MPEAEGQVESRDFALLVGVKSYTNLDPMASTINDIGFVKRWLCHQRGGSVPDNHVFVVSDPQHGDEVADQAKRVANEAKRIGGARRIYMFWSGHGHTAGNSDVHLCMPSWDRNDPAHVVTAQSYMRAFIESDLFEEVLGFFDCCRDILTAKSVPTSRPPFDCSTTEKATRFRGSLTFFGTKDKTRAWHFDELDGPRQSGYFTKAVVDGLMGDAIEDPSQVGVTIDQLQDYAIQRTREFSTHRVSSQCPDPHLYNIGQCKLGCATPMRKIELTAVKPYRKGSKLIGPRGRVCWEATADIDIGATIEMEVERYNYILLDHAGKPVWTGIVAPDFEPLREGF